MKIWLWQANGSFFIFFFIFSHILFSKLLHSDQIKINWKLLSRFKLSQLSSIMIIVLQELHVCYVWLFLMKWCTVSWNWKKKMMTKLKGTLVKMWCCLPLSFITTPCFKAAYTLGSHLLPFQISKRYLKKQKSYDNLSKSDNVQFQISVPSPRRGICAFI